MKVRLVSCHLELLSMMEGKPAHAFVILHKDEKGVLLTAVTGLLIMVFLNARLWCLCVC